MVADMDRRTTRRLLKAAFGLSSALALLVLTAPSIAAQVPDPSEVIEDVTNAVDDVTTGTGDEVADTVEDVTEDVGDTVGGELGQTTEDIGSTAGNAVRDATGAAGDVVGGTGSTVGDVIDDVTGGSEEPAPGTNGGAPNVDGGGTNGRIDGGSLSRDRNGNSTTTTGTDIAPLGSVPGTTIVRDDSFRSSTEGSGPAGGGILDALGGITFPLALIAIVAAFLAVQGRVDKGDPKLSLALLDPEDDMLSFR